MLTIATVLLHAVSLGGFDGPATNPSDALTAPMAVTMQTRWVDEPTVIAPTHTETASKTPVPASPHRSMLASTSSSTKTALTASVAPTDSKVDEAASTTVAPTTPATLELASAQTTAATTSTADDASASTSLSPAEETLPHYRTRPPPALTMHYDLRRGMLNGNGELDWQPQSDRYEMKLSGRVGSLSVLTQTSSGSIDANGLAPVRFTDQRMSRAATAVNFQRAAGKITFSGPSNEYPLRDGVQDRVSWMIQLASIISAEPKLRVADAKVGMWVVGSHGEAAIWMFRCIGPEAIETPNGTVNTIKYVRNPRDENDANVQVWLDPQHFYLPVRASQQSGPRDQPFELRIESITTNR